MMVVYVPRTAEEGMVTISIGCQLVEVLGDSELLLPLNAVTLVDSGTAAPADCWRRATLRSRRS